MGGKKGQRVQRLGLIVILNLASLVLLTASVSLGLLPSLPHQT